MKKKLKKIAKTKQAPPTGGAKALLLASIATIGLLPAAYLMGQSNANPSKEEVKITLNTCTAAKKSCGEMRDKLQETINLLPDPAPVASIKKAAPKKKHRIVKKKHHRKHYAHKPCNCICMPRIFARG